MKSAPPTLQLVPAARGDRAPESMRAPRIEAKRASALGFTAETSFDEIIRTHIADELGGKVAA